MGIFQHGFLPSWWIRKQGQAITWKAYPGSQNLLAKPGVPKVPCPHGTSWKTGDPTHQPVESFYPETTVAGKAENAGIPGQSAKPFGKEQLEPVVCVWGQGWVLPSCIVSAYIRRKHVVCAAFPVESSTGRSQDG